MLHITLAEEEEMTNSQLYEHIFCSEYGAKHREELLKQYKHKISELEHEHRRMGMMLNDEVLRAGECSMVPKDFRCPRCNQFVGNDFEDLMEHDLKCNSKTNKGNGECPDCGEYAEDIANHHCRVNTNLLGYRNYFQGCDVNEDDDKYNI